MTVLNTANRLYRGTALVANAYIGTTLVWPVLNPAFAVFDAALAERVILTGGGLNVKNTSSGMASSGARVGNASGKTAGKFYHEATMTAWATGGSIMVGGICTILSNFADLQYNGTGGIMLNSTGQVWSEGGVPTNIGALVNGNIAGFATDLTNMKWWVRKSAAGIWNNNGSADPATNVGGFTIPTGTLVPAVSFGGVSTGPGNIIKTNLGQYAFNGAVPSGFTAGWTV